MSIVPFARLPIKEYRLKTDPRPRIDIQYLADYVESESSESEEEEQNYTFSSDSESEEEEKKDEEENSEEENSDEEGSGQSQSYDEYEEEGGEENVSNSYYTIDELETLSDEEEEGTNSTESDSNKTKMKKPKKPDFKSRVKAYIRSGKRYQRFQAWRKKKAEKRRHKMLRYWESQIEKMDIKIRDEIQQQMDEDEEALLRHNRKLRKIKKAQNFRARRVIHRDTRFEKEKRRRKKEHERIQFNVWNMEIWARQDFEKAESAAAIAEEYARLEQERKDAEVNLAMKNNAAFQDEHMLGDDIRETQMVMKAGRIAGTLAGVNADKHKIPVETPLEITRNLTIFIRPEIDFKWKPKHMRTKAELAPFNVNLTIYRDVEKLRAFQIGQRGALALASEFLRGSCSNVKDLNLGRCQIHSRGLGKILHGLRIGRVVNLQKLNLRGNCICASGLHFLKNGLANGSIANLKHLDLRENELCDEGAHLVAHMMISGVFEQIATLHLQRNMITDVGIEKIVHVYRAVFEVKCPVMTKLSLEENYASIKMKQSLKPTPKGVSI